ncbi:MAG TPA: YtxH domain-containing protein [Caldilineae bacterium]|nr:YtxH domain-containing protein [Caldilineae bacterium]
MKNLFTLLVGMLIGVIVALLFAPERGEDLRMQLHERAGVDMQRLQRTWQQEMEQMSTQVAKMQGQVQDMQKQVADRMGKSPEVEQS